MTLLCYDDDGGRKEGDTGLVRVDKEEGGGSYLCSVQGRSRNMSVTGKHKPEISPRYQSLRYKVQGTSYQIRGRAVIIL